MGINLSNFLGSLENKSKMNEFQDLDHIDGISISSVSANLYFPCAILIFSVSPLTT